MYFAPVIFIIVLATLVVAIPHPSEHGAGLAVPITKRSTRFLKADGSIDFAALDSHIALTEAKIHQGYANYERNMGTVHPAAMNGVQKRASSGAPESLADDNSELWYGTISIGNPPKSITVAFSTGSADLIVPLTTCDSTCSGHTLWDPTSSSSSHDLGLTFGVAFGDGSSTFGETYSDDVSIAGFTATTQTILGAKTYSDGLESGFFPADGILGMAFPTISAFNATPIIQTLAAQGAINPVFSFLLTSSGGELFVGGANSARYTGDFVYAPLLGQDFWNVQLDFIEGNGNTLVTYIDAVIDTGTTAIIGDANNVSSLHSALGGSAVSGQTGYYSFPCNSFPSITFWFGMTAFPISASSLNLGPISSGSSNCLSGIVGGSATATSWIVGDVFLTNVYTTFDITNNQVGFATLA